MANRLSRGSRSWLFSGVVVGYTSLLLSQGYVVWAEACLLIFLMCSLMGLQYEDTAQLLDW